MNPAHILERARADGVTLTLSSVGTIKATGEGAAVNRWLPVIRAHKAEILATLQDAANDSMPDLAAGTRRQRVLAMRDKQPGTRYAVLVDNPDTDPVLVRVAVRDVATFDLAIPAAKFDAFKLLDMIGHHGGATVH